MDKQFKIVLNDIKAIVGLMDDSSFGQIDHAIALLEQSIRIKRKKLMTETNEKSADNNH